MATPSPILTWTFAVLTLLVSLALPAAVYWIGQRSGDPRGANLRATLIATFAVGTWMALTGAAAAAGLLDFGRMPPPIGILFVIMIVVTVLLVRSPLGGRLATQLPLAALVGIHAFRLPLEILMHRAAVEGVMPLHMSYSGLNFDILSGIGAIIVASLLVIGKGPLWVVRLWNWGAFLLLINIVTIAWLSTPTPFRVFDDEPANVWITHPPFVWLPAVLVLTALIGHLLLFRRLRTMAASRPAAADLVGSREGVLER